MSISALISSSVATQLSAFNRVSGSNTGSTDSVGGARPPRQDDNGFLDAVSSALSSIGVTLPDTASSGSTGAGTSTASSDTGQVLGAFLHQLMGGLHALAARKALSPRGTLALFLCASLSPALAGLLHLSEYVWNYMITVWHPTSK